MSTHLCPDCGNHAEIDPELHDLEQIRVEEEKKELIWNKLCTRWATKHFPRCHVFYESVEILPNGTKLYDWQWWED